MSSFLVRRCPDRKHQLCQVWKSAELKRQSPDIKRFLAPPCTVLSDGSGPPVYRKHAGRGPGKRRPSPVLFLKCPNSFVLKEFAGVYGRIMRGDTGSMRHLCGGHMAEKGCCQAGDQPGSALSQTFIVWERLTPSVSSQVNEVVAPVSAWKSLRARKRSMGR